MSPRRDTVLKAAVALFAEQGFAATSINDIERAAGLSVGSGGTYRHFKSKEAMLEAAIDNLVTDLHDRLDPEPSSLEVGFRDSISFLRDNQPLLRILMRDLDAFPSLRHKVVEELHGHAFRMASERTAVFAPHLDTEAVAAMLGSATVGFVMLETLADWRPLGVDDDRLIEVLTAVYLNLLTSEPE